MAITEEFEYDCEVRGEFKAVQVRQANVIKKDGVEVSRTYHRKILYCRVKNGNTWSDTDISGEDETIQAVCLSLIHI